MFPVDRGALSNQYLWRKNSPQSVAKGKGVGAEDGSQRRADLAKQNKICFAVAYLRSAIQPRLRAVWQSVVFGLPEQPLYLNGCSFYYTKEKDELNDF